jgi:hypothetical protein
MLKMHTSCVSHDIRAPAKAVTQVIEMVLDMENVDEAAKNLLQPAMCASQILKFQICSLLDFNLVK